MYIIVKTEGGNSNRLPRRFAGQCRSVDREDGRIRPHSLREIYRKSRHRYLFDFLHAN